MKAFSRFYLVLVFASSPVWALAASSDSIGSFKDWDAYSYTEKGNKVCYIAAVPLDSEPKNVKRGPIFFYVTHRAKGKVSDEVSLFMGYPLRGKTAVRVEIEGQRFDLDTQGENAWTKSTKQDIKLVAAMIKGNEMVVRGTSKRGTRTVDRYSLLGFTAAHRAIDKACRLAK